MMHLIRQLVGTVPHLIEVAGERRRLRDKLSWNELQLILAHARRHRHRVGEVTRIRQRARAGTKAWMHWIADTETSGQSTDAVWVRDVHLAVGELFIVSGRFGHGEHHDETVFYINRIEGSISRQTYKGWMRHQSRLLN